MRQRGRNEGCKGSGSGPGARVGARFLDVKAMRVFLGKLGMPGSLLTQLSQWLEGLVPGELEEMEPELEWEGRNAKLVIRAEIDEEDGGVDVEFEGPATLIEALQADLDEFFQPRQKKGKP